MSAAAVATLPAPVPAADQPKAVEEVVAPAARAGEAPALDASTAVKDDTPVSTTTAHKKRSPFGDLKNKLFHSKSNSTSPTREKVVPEPAKVEETPKENVPAVEEPVAPAVAAEEPAVAPAAVASETSDAEEHQDKKEKHDRPKSPGVFDKVKSFFGDKKEKKGTSDSPTLPKDLELTPSPSLGSTVKTPTEEKPQPLVEAAAAAGPVESTTAAEAPAATTAPDTVALAEASAAAAAPVPQIVEPVGQAVDEPTDEQVKELSEAEKPVVAEGVKEEEKGEVKVDESTTTEDKPKRDLTKLSRRLSAKVGAFLSSPKKEKKEKDVVPAVPAEEHAPATAAEPVVPEASTSTAAAEAPKVEAVEEPKKDESVEAAPVVEAAKEEVVAPVDAPAEELAMDVEAKKDEPVAAAA
ncbi:hypothetical protein Rt10032_c02g0979 [Rhodotorula toruloides]|uniref:Uncharacterized protein n=1 Tax=Rhodotorula toruloides TaxID=5286 RepID=A0A511K9F4_RHOTO|nr:hypothetical protein Rt10032_c02g0979 [Rhodotorula toruloides]